MENIILKNISKKYTGRHSDVTALKNVNLQINSGEFISITGHSGSGKSTLMNIIGLLDTASEGEYYLMGEDVKTFDDKKISQIRNLNIGFIFQDFNLIDNLTAYQNTMLPLLYRNLKQSERISRTKNALKQVGLLYRSEHLPSELSGGQRQRAAIARVIAASPPIVLADEPTGNLDPEKRDEILNIFSDFSNEGKTVIIITHDQKVANRTNRQIKICDGELKG